VSEDFIWVSSVCGIVHLNITPCLIPQDNDDLSRIQEVEWKMLIEDVTEDHATISLTHDAGHATSCLITTALYES